MDSKCVVRRCENNFERNAFKLLKKIKAGSIDEHDIEENQIRGADGQRSRSFIDTPAFGDHCHFRAVFASRCFSITRHATSSSTIAARSDVQIAGVSGCVTGAIFGAVIRASSRLSIPENTRLCHHSSRRDFHFAQKRVYLWFPGIRTS